MTRPTPSLAALSEALQAHDAADLRTRRKLARGLGHDAMAIAASETELAPADFDILLRALMAGARAHSYPQRYLKAQAQLMARRRMATGAPDPEVAAEVARTVDVEMGAIVVFDATAGLPDAFWPVGGQSFNSAMNAGAFFMVGLPGDGPLMVRFRLLSSGPLEPHTAEFRRMRGATPVAFLVAPSGQLVVHGGGDVRLTVTAGTERMHARAFHLGAGRSQEVLLLAGPAYGVPPPPLTGTPELEIY